MAKKLCVHIHLFSFNQDVFMADGNDVKRIASTSIDRLNDVITTTMQDNEIDEIELNGDEQYIQSIAYRLLEGIEKFYSNENVRITINGEVFNQ